MKWQDIKEDGRIVKGVNTTADVGPDEIKKQAAKFGNKVDKDGRPPTLSKKIKGKSTNVLFNLGLAESVDKTAQKIVKLYEAESMGKIDKNTEIYVDMDGVLADFFGDWAKLMGVNSFRDIKDVDQALEKIKDTDDFWLNLPLTDNAKGLLKLIKQVKGEYSICSSPLPGDKNSIPHKKEWIKKNLAFFPPKEIIITHNKPQFAKQPDGTPNILIDDYGVNIDKWEASGGIGFKHKDHKFERTAKAIKQHMQEPVEEGNLLKNPKNTFLTKADTAYDFIKVGTNLANLKSMPAGSNMDEPDIMIAPYAGSKEMKYLMKQLNRIGYKTQDAQGYKDAHFDDEPTGGEAPPQLKRMGPLGKIKIHKLKSVQNERLWHKLGKQLVNVLNDDYAPLQIDRKGRVINGHHRLDALRLTGAEYARVHMVDEVLENMLGERYADDQREKTKRTLAKHDKAMIKVARDSIKKYEKDKEDKEQKDENFAYNEAFVKPQFDVEWGEATRYPEFKKLGKKEWIKLAKKGKAVTIKNAKDINNTDAADPASFKSLDKNKQARALAQLKSGDVEMPIVAVYSDGYKELIGGNTRLTAMMAKDGKATVWQFEVPDEVAELAENFADGTLYHATYKPLLKSIQANGLGGGGAQTKWTDSKPGVVYLAKDPDVAVSYAETSDEVPEEWLDQIVVLAISTDSLDTSKLKDDENVLDDDSTLEYHGVIKKFKLGENFADGKKKGKSRPGRVKKAGASCKGSVTSLRKKAAKYSGEKGKMYHWCANMKGGKKK